MSSNITINACQISQYTIENCNGEELNRQRQKVLDLLIERDKDFLFAPSVHVVYPIVEQFLQSPVAYIQKLLIQYKEINSIVLLTTYGSLLQKDLCMNGYTYEKINMPAAPEHTAMFTKKHAIFNTEQSKTLYIELVDEDDERIKPSVVLTLSNADNCFYGGVCSSMQRVGDDLYAYLSIMAVSASAPKGAGTALLKAVIAYWQKQGVKAMHLGTQTASGFYLNNGFKIIHHVLPHIRLQLLPDGSFRNQDLVMMEYSF